MRMLAHFSSVSTYRRSTYLTVYAFGFFLTMNSPEEGRIKTTFDDDYVPELSPLTLSAILHPDSIESPVSGEEADEIYSVPASVTTSSKSPTGARPRPDDLVEPNRAHKRPRRTPSPMEEGSDSDEIDFLDPRAALSTDAASLSTPIARSTGGVVTRTPSKMDVDMDNTSTASFTPQRAYVIPLPTPPASGTEAFDFPSIEGQEPAVPFSESSDPTKTQLGLDLPYSLPALKTLPSEFNRKGRVTKQRKREKEKLEKGLDKVDGKREEWTPMGVNKWGATVRANPVWKSVAHASKCVSSRDWTVRFIRCYARMNLD
jgi:chromatin modification-related protein VID21